MGTGNDPAVGVPYGFPQPHGVPGPGPQNAGYAAQNAGGYYPQDLGGYPPQHAGGYPPQHAGGYPPQNAGGYPPQAFGGHPPQNAGGYAPQSPGYGPQGAGFQPPGSPGPAPGSPYVFQAPAMVQMSQDPYQAGHIPSNALYAHVEGVHLRNTFYGDTPAPFECIHCGKPGLTTVRSERSVATYVACMMSACIGICFLFPSCDCLWHKYHYCPNCGEKVGDLIKTDPCLVVDPTQWTRPSFGVPL